ncbi:hypothetical protein [Streptomyces boluensis]|uniref:Uncharacterized protein n=1 Tax=Streptomyces boluensis TaxID=1775135 RepID=A0A964UWK5_9ACTN|nr:hypothetical protein [Streptomyces boluensis]NBE56741.1 hypothetical protein [Streptomyces boluensis]
MTSASSTASDTAQRSPAHPSDERRSAAVGRAGEVLQTYTSSPEARRRGPSETLQRVIADLMHWCDDSRRDFDRALEAARDLHARERAGA